LEVKEKEAMNDKYDDFSKSFMKMMRKSKKQHIYESDSDSDCSSSDEEEERERRRRKLKRKLRKLEEREVECSRLPIMHSTDDKESILGNCVPHPTDVDHVVYRKSEELHAPSELAMEDCLVTFPVTKEQMPVIAKTFEQSKERDWLGRKRMRCNSAFVTCVRENTSALMDKPELVEAVIDHMRAEGGLCDILKTFLEKGVNLTPGLDKVVLEFADLIEKSARSELTANDLGTIGRLKVQLEMARPEYASFAEADMLEQAQEADRLLDRDISTLEDMETHIERLKETRKRHKLVERLRRESQQRALALSERAFRQNEIKVKEGEAGSQTSPIGNVGFNNEPIVIRAKVKQDCEAVVIRHNEVSRLLEETINLVSNMEETGSLRAYEALDRLRKEIDSVQHSQCIPCEVLKEKHRMLLKRVKDHEEPKKKDQEGSAV